MVDYRDGCLKGIMKLLQAHPEGLSFTEVVNQNLKSTQTKKRWTKDTIANRLVFGQNQNLIERNSGTRKYSASVASYDKMIVQETADFISTDSNPNIFAPSGLSSGQGRGGICFVTVSKDEDAAFVEEFSLRIRQKLDALVPQLEDSLVQAYYDAKNKASRIDEQDQRLLNRYLDIQIQLLGLFEPKTKIPEFGEERGALRQKYEFMRSTLNNLEWNLSRKGQQELAMYIDSLINAGKLGKKFFKMMPKRFSNARIKKSLISLSKILRRHEAKFRDYRYRYVSLPRLVFTYVSSQSKTMSESKLWNVDALLR